MHTENQQEDNPRKKICKVVLCGGPPKAGRVRHLEKKTRLFKAWRKPVVDIVLDACSSAGGEVYVVLSKDNVDLRRHIDESGKDVKCLIVNDHRMISTYEAALSVDNRGALLVYGDLTRITGADIQRMEQSSLESAICCYEIPWGRDLVSADGELIKRGDIGAPLMKLSARAKGDFISESARKSAREYFSRFYPGLRFDEHIANHYSTWLIYSYFFEICSSRSRSNEAGDGRGAITYKSRLYKDND